MSAIIGLYLLISPLLQSHAPPWASVADFTALAQNYAQMQSTQQSIANTLKRVTDKQDQQDLDYWTGQLAIAEARLKIASGDSLAAEMRKVAMAQITMIQERMKLK